MSKRRIEVWAHRGASGSAPENTLEAFALALEQKADGVELDVQMTADGQLVVIHDETLDRTSNGSGSVGQYTLEELKKFKFNKLHPEYQDAAIPTLEEVYELLRPSDMTINVELKTSVVRYKGIEKKAAAATKAMGMKDRVIFSSFNHYSIVEMEEHIRCRRGLLFSDVFIDTPAYARHLNVDALHPALCLTRMPKLMKQYRRSGLDVNVWTVNEEEDLGYLLDQGGIHAVITNWPDRARACLERLTEEKAGAKDNKNRDKEKD